MSSTSANTGTAPAATTALTVAMNVNAGTTTSSPQPTPSAASAQRSAAVPLATAIAYVQPSVSHAARSKSATASGGGAVLVAEQRAAAYDSGHRFHLRVAEQRGTLREVERLGPYGGAAVDGEREIIPQHAGDRTMIARCMRPRSGWWTPASAVDSKSRCASSPRAREPRSTRQPPSASR